MSVAQPLVLRAHYMLRPPAVLTLSSLYYAGPSSSINWTLGHFLLPTSPDSSHHLVTRPHITSRHPLSPYALNLHRVVRNPYPPTPAPPIVLRFHALGWVDYLGHPTHATLADRAS